MKNELECIQNQAVAIICPGVHHLDVLEKADITSSTDYKWDYLQKNFCIYRKKIV